MKKHWTLEELTNLIGEETLNRLFIEHYLMLAGKEEVNNHLIDTMLEEPDETNSRRHS